MEVSGFNRLEQKLEELLDRLVSLKSENSSLREALAQKERELAELNQRAAAMEAERNQVRQRIESLVEKLETAIAP